MSDRLRREEAGPAADRPGHDKEDLMNDDLYRLVDGEPVISTAGFALLLGVPLDEFKAEMRRQELAANWSRGPFTFAVPPEWAQRGRRIRKEISAALGYEPGMKDALDYLASK